ncbi:hypothetical protein [Sulfobacillus thermosulfidooxidans]|uniref:hypothetical protein n=1 Tax=Sulfobacillus thermosulfidooxidans TaxID=28034 RepID=UPI0006B4ECB4|nr:hypothetical protein [Sulfobacillus thermosulfidooxidans]
MHRFPESQWTMHYFTVSMISLLLAEIGWFMGWGNPLKNLGTPSVLVLVHLTTIGFLSLAMLGALHQFLPIITQTELSSQRGSAFTLGSIILGLAVMIVGFLASPGGTLPQVPWILPLGGTIVIIGVLVALKTLGTILQRSWPWTLPTWFVATGLGFLILTIFAGVFLSFSLVVPSWFSSSALYVIGGRGLAAHVIGGMGGWLTLTAMGVSYRLLGMFTLSNDPRGWWGWTAYVFTAVGILAVWISRWVGANIVAEVAWLVVLVGLATYLVDIGRLYHRRKRRKLELNARYAVGPFIFLSILLISAIFIPISGQFTAFDLGVVFLGLYGWLGGLVLTQLYKIVPFLTWIHVFGNQIGQGKMPRVQDLVDEKRDHYAFFLYFIATFVAAVALALGWFALFRIFMFGMWIATLDITRALYHASLPYRNAKRKNDSTNSLSRSFF